MYFKYPIHRKAWFMVLLVCLMPCLPISSQDGLSAENPPPNGFVPNEETAIRIAIAVWIPIYGKKLIDDEAPYKATLVGDSWVVSGTLPRNEDGSPGVGGVALAQISKKDGRILRVIHER